MRDYQVKTIEQAKGMGWPEADEYGDYDADFRCGLWELQDGKPVRLLGTDCGEPEDNRFTRDWSWVRGELQRAYDDGLAASLKSSGSTSAAGDRETEAGTQ